MTKIAKKGSAAHALQRAFSRYERVGKVQSNLLSLNSVGEVTESQFREQSQQYLALKEQCLNELKLIRARIKQERTAAQLEHDTIQKESEQILLRVKLGELEIGRVSRTIDRLVERRNFLQSQIAEYESLLDARSSTDVGGYLDLPLDTSVTWNPTSISRTRLVVEFMRSSIERFGLALQSIRHAKDSTLRLEESGENVGVSQTRKQILWLTSRAKIVRFRPLAGVITLSVAVITIWWLYGTLTGKGLPKSYGVFVMDGGRATQLTGKILLDDFSPSAFIIIYDKRVGTKADELDVFKVVEDPVVPQSEVGTSQTSAQFWDNLERGIQQQNASLDAMISGIPSNSLVVTCEKKPVSRNEEMIQLAPQHDLPPGKYVVRGQGGFYVKKSAYTEDLRTRYELQGNRAADSGNWDGALAVINQGLKLFPGNKSFYTLRDALPKRIVADAESKLSEGEWKQALALCTFALREPAFSGSPETQARDVIRNCLFEEVADGAVRARATEKLWLKEASASGTWNDVRQYSLDREAVGWRLPSSTELSKLYGAFGFLTKSKDRRLLPFTWGGTKYWTSSGTIFDFSTGLMSPNLGGAEAYNVILTSNEN